MAGGAEVGQGHVSIFPSFKGFRAAVSKEMSGAAKSGSNSFAAGFDGKSAGNRLGRGLKDGFNSSSQGFSEEALKPFRADVSKAAQSYSAALLKSKDASLNVAAAQEKLNAAVDKYGAGSLQAEKAQIRVEQAKLRESVATDNLKTATERLSDAKARLKAVEEAGAKAAAASTNAMGGIGSQLKNVTKAFLGMNQFPEWSGKLSGFVKSGLTTFGGFAVQVGSKISTGLKSAVGPVQGAISGLGGRIGQAASAAAGLIPQPFKNAVAGVGTYLGGIGAAVGGALSSIPSKVSGIAGSIGGFFAQAAQKATESLKSIATVGMAGLSTAAVAAIPAIVGIGKSALSAYAEYEQAVGGIDTLFKGASQTVQNFAKDAYKTAGVSANEYMTQITSFSASLISSLGGNTAKAAQMGNMALTDMSDNANKMGTDLGSIQQTYQSLARGNYAMLDNLKLGYGGTKTEMERLISDANKLEQANGKAGNLTISKFSDVVQAIHDVQTQMDITGTTAREAATTIEGSVGSMKAAWTNWLTELGKDDADIPGLTEKLAESIGAALSNILPRIGSIAASVVQSIPDMFSALTRTLPQPFQSAIGKIAEIFSNFGPLVAGFGASFAVLGTGPLLSKLPIVGETFQALAKNTKFAGKVFSALTGPIGMIIAGLAALIATSPELRNLFGQQMSGIVASFGSALGQLAPIAKQLADSFGGAFGQIMPVITSTVAQLLPLVGTLVQSLMPLIPAILNPLMQAIQLLVPPLANIITTLLPPLTGLIVSLLPPVQQIIGAVVQIVGALMTALMPAVQQLIPIITDAVSVLVPIITMLSSVVGFVATQIADYINSVVVPTVQGLMPVVTSVIGTIGAILQNVVGIIRGVVNIISGIFSGDWNRVWSGIGQVVSNAVNGIGNYLGGMVDIGANLVKGLWNGISSLGEWIWGKIEGFCGGIVDKIKGFFGIHSPSRLFRDEIGMMLGRGLAVGVDESHPIVSQAVKRLTDVIPGDIGMGVNAVATAAPNQGSQTQGIPAAGQTIKNVTVNNSIDGRGMDPNTLLAVWAQQSKAAVERW